MAVEEPLGMDNIGDPGACPADRELIAAGHMLAALKVLFQGLHFILSVCHKFNVITRGKADITVTVLVCYVTDFTNILNAHEPATAAPDGKDLVSGFRYMDKDARLQDIMIFPFAVIVLDNRRKILPEMPGTKVCEPVFHGFFRVK